MPELPEVETMRRDLDDKVSGRSIHSVHILDQRVIHSLSNHMFKSRLIGSKIESVSRRGKALILVLANGLNLVVQVKMTGYMLVLKEKQASYIGDTRVIFELEDGRVMTYNDQRVLGWLYLVERLSDVPLFQTLGPEPFDEQVTVNWFQEKTGAHRLDSPGSRKRSIAIKVLLLDQCFIAGIGNIYASEILFAAQVSPFKPAYLLTDLETERVIDHSKRILNRAIKMRGTSMRNYRDSEGRKGQFMDLIQVYGKKDQPCPTCSSMIQRAVQNARSTFFCPACQHVEQDDFARSHANVS